MAAFLRLPSESALRRAPWDWTDHESTLRVIDGQPLQAVRFAHPDRGVHFVYVDAGNLDPGGLPGQAERNDLARMLERALSREGM